MKNNKWVSVIVFFGIIAVAVSFRDQLFGPHGTEGSSSVPVDLRCGMNSEDTDKDFELWQKNKEGKFTPQEKQQYEEWCQKRIERWNSEGKLKVQNNKEACKKLGCSEGTHCSMDLKRCDVSAAPQDCGGLCGTGTLCDVQSRFCFPSYDE